MGGYVVMLIDCFTCSHIYDSKVGNICPNCGSERSAIARLVDQAVQEYIDEGLVEESIVDGKVCWRMTEKGRKQERK
jgi:hypothetical protein